MSIKLMSEVWTLALDHPQQSILLALADFANDKGGSIFPSMAYVAWKTGYSERQVKRIIHGLTDSGLLLELEEVRGRGRTNEYEIRLEKGVKKSPFNEHQKVTKRARKHDIQDVKGDISAVKHDIAMSPDPLVEPLDDPLVDTKGVSQAKPPVRQSSVCDEVFIAELIADQTYAGINVSREYGKMCNWCRLRNRAPSRRRFINWLNNAEPTYTPEGNGNGRNGHNGNGAKAVGSHPRTNSEWAVKNRV